MLFVKVQPVPEVHLSRFLRHKFSDCARKSFGQNRSKYSLRAASCVSFLLNACSRTLTMPKKCWRSALDMTPCAQNVSVCVP